MINRVFTLFLLLSSMLAVAQPGLPPMPEQQQRFCLATEQGAADTIAFNAMDAFARQNAKRHTQAEYNKAIIDVFGPNLEFSGWIGYLEALPAQPGYAVLKFSFTCPYRHVGRAWLAAVASNTELHTNIRGQLLLHTPVQALLQ